MSEETKFKFFEVCTQEQNYSPDSTPCKYIYNNSLDVARISEKARNLCSSEKKIKQWYEEFIRNKFRYFLLLVKHAESADREMNNILGDNSNRWTLILKHWRTQADKERLAYLYRISQMPEPTVISFWYNNLAEFIAWGRLCREQLNLAKQNLLSRDFNLAYQKLESKINSTFEIPLEDEHLRTWIQQRVAQGITSSTLTLFSHLCSEDRVGKQIGKIQEYFELQPQGELSTLIYAPVTQRVMQRLSLAFLDLVSRGINEEQYYIGQSLQIIKSEFQCDLCDYLEVQGERIVLTSTTVDLLAMAKRCPEKTQEQFLLELTENQSYLKGEGISGSILLWPGSKYPWFHVGSNNLPEDPRKSIWKEELYEVLYSDSLKGGKGKIKNFWAFPIVIGHKLMGAFRVVNMLDKNQNELLPGGWPLFVRLQLCMVAEQLSRLLEHIKSLPGMSILDLQTRIKERATFIREVMNQLDLLWVSETFLSKIIEHLKSITFQRKENKPLGCSLVILQNKDKDGFLAEFKKYQSIKIKTSEAALLSDFAVYYDRVSPKNVAFVFNEEGNFIEVVEIPEKSDSADEHQLLKTTKHWNSVAFLVEGGKESILIYRKGVLMAEYFLYRRLGHGNWKMRYYSPAFNKICQTITNISRPILKRVYKEVQQLSYKNKGAGIIIAEDLDKYCTFEEKDEYEKLEDSIFALTGEKFANFAERDGSIIMNPAGIISRAGVYVYAKKQEHMNLNDELNKLIKRDDRGGRHRSGAQVCCACPNALMFIVSANRSIAVLHNGHAIMWDF